MHDLIAKLEAAKEGSRELDAEIAKAVGRVPDGVTLCEGGEWLDTEACRVWIPPRFTTSLDAAVTLADDKPFELHRGFDGKAIAGVVTGGIDGPNVADAWENEGETPALAMCIASLKARVA